MATPMVTGTFALMYDAAYTAGGGTIRFSAIDMGEQKQIRIMAVEDCFHTSLLKMPEI